MGVAEEDSAVLLVSLSLYASALVSSGTPAQGVDYLKRSEVRLYRWPQGLVVSFEAQTDVLAPMILAMKRDLAKQPDAEASRLVAALERLSVHGTIDTTSGATTADVRIDFTSSDPRTVSALEEIRRRVKLTITGCFQGVPLQDPALLHPGSTVTACEESADAIVVTITGGSAGASTRVSLARASLLPEKIETEAFVGRYRFEESFPGRFAPSQLDLSPRGGTDSRAEYSYQKQGELLFPATVKVTSGSQHATITFRSLTLGKRAPS